MFENLAATVQLPTGPTTFFAVHPIPPSPMDGNRGREVFAALRAFLGSRDLPAVAAGDFNATRDNVPRRDLASDGWVDAAETVGAGMVRTWPNDLAPLPPLVALDHVLARDGPSAAKVTVIDIDGTDHRAVVAGY